VVGYLTYGHEILLAPNFHLYGNKKTANINVKNEVYKTVIGDVVAHLKYTLCPIIMDHCVYFEPRKRL